MDKSELKDLMVAKGLSEEQADALIEFGEKADVNGNEPLEFGSFKAYLNEEQGVVIEAISGWKIVYPAVNDAWVYLVAWMSDWENCKEIMETFVMAIVYPVCNRLMNIDQQYVNDIFKAQVSLDGRLEAMENAFDHDDL